MDEADISGNEAEHLYHGCIGKGTIAVTDHLATRELKRELEKYKAPLSAFLRRRMLMPQEKEELLQELLERYSKLHMKQAFNSGVPYDDVEDVVLEAYWSFYQSRHFGNLSEEETKVMMAHIVRNKCRDYYRKNRHMETVGIDECRDEFELSHHAPVQDPLSEMIQNEEYRYICQCIEEMKEIWREPAFLHFIEGYTPQEIHKILGISETVCRSRLSRARKHLREKLADIQV